MVIVGIFYATFVSERNFVPKLALHLKNNYIWGNLVLAFLYYRNVNNWKIRLLARLREIYIFIPLVVLIVWLAKVFILCTRPNLVFVPSRWSDLYHFIQIFLPKLTKMSEQPANGSNEDEATENFRESKLIETDMSEMSVEPNDSSRIENKSTTEDVKDSKFIGNSEMTEKYVEIANDKTENFNESKSFEKETSFESDNVVDHVSSKNSFKVPKIFRNEIKGKSITLSPIKIPTVEEALRAFQILKLYLQSKNNNASDLFEALNRIEKFCLEDKLEHQMSNRIQVKIEKPDYFYDDEDDGDDDDNDFEPICQLDEKIEHLKEKIQDLNENSSISIYRNNPVKLEQPDPDELEEILDDNKFFDKDLNLIKMEKHMPIKIENTSYQNYHHHSVFHKQQNTNGVPKTKKKHKGSMNIKCVLCDTNFTTKSSLDAHIQAKHFKGLKTFQCNFCSHSFSFERYLKLHIEAVHNSKPKVFRCDLCATTFLVKEELKTHMNDIHKGEKNYQCDECVSISKFVFMSLFRNKRFMLDEIV